jgi:hypothetical protein
MVQPDADAAEDQGGAGEAEGDRKADQQEADDAQEHGRGEDLADGHAAHSTASVSCSCW